MNGTRKALLVRDYDDGTRQLDELLRRTLRIGNPSDPEEVARGLRSLYAADAAKIDEEAQGLPISGVASPLAAAPAAPGDSPGDREQRRLEEALRVDLAAVVEAPANREWKPELAGWRGVMLRELAEGCAAARLAQDPARRDRAMLAVRKLGEFARLSRFVGVLHPEMTYPYRRLATTLDEAASAIRILAGEALYRAGLADGGLVLSVPLEDLRQRRDALVVSLRRFANVSPGSDADDWGEGMKSYGDLVQALDHAGAADLKPYLREESLTAIFDEILDDLGAAAGRKDPEMLRQLAATLPVELSRMKRLLLHARQALRPAGGTKEAWVESAPQGRFLSALKLLVDALSSMRGGARLIDLGVPLAMAAAQIDEADAAARQTLQKLVTLRAGYAREVECQLQCTAGKCDGRKTQVQLDKVLFDIDRAIDLYALGQGTEGKWGEEEQRARVRGKVAENLAEDQGLPVDLRASLDDIHQILDLALPPWSRFDEARQDVVTDAIAAAHAKGVLSAQDAGERAGATLQSYTPGPGDPTRDEIVLAIVERWTVIDKVLAEMRTEEDDWQQLVATLASRCTAHAELLCAGQELLRGATPDSTGLAVPRTELSIPRPLRVVAEDTIARVRGPAHEAYERFMKVTALSNGTPQGGGTTPSSDDEEDTSLRNPPARGGGGTGAEGRGSGGMSLPDRDKVLLLLLLTRQAVEAVLALQPAARSAAWNAWREELLGGQAMRFGGADTTKEGRFDFQGWHETREALKKSVAGSHGDLERELSQIWETVPHEISAWLADAARAVDRLFLKVLQIPVN